MAYLINCRVCHAKISSDANFCPYCGDTKINESVKIAKLKKAEEERKKREQREKEIQKEREYKRRKQKIKEAKEYFDNLPVQTIIEKEQKEYSASTVFGFLAQKTVYELEYKKAIIETYKAPFTHEKVINYIIMVFNNDTMYYKYKYVSEEEFIQYGGKPLSKWEKFWL